jgi:hypothetical protein
VLLAGFDIPSVGALGSVVKSRELLAVALVIAPARSERTVAAIEWSLVAGEPAPQRPLSDAAAALKANAMADALPFYEALARAEAESLDLPLGTRLALRLRLEPQG